MEKFRRNEYLSQTQSVLENYRYCQLIGSDCQLLSAALDSVPITKMLSLETPVAKLSSIGPTYTKRLSKLGIRTVKDLLWHLPTRFEDFSQLKRIADLEGGELATVLGTVQKISSRRSNQKRIFITSATLAADSKKLTAFWFNQPYLAKTIVPGDRIALAGRVERTNQDFKMISPEWERVLPHHLLIHTARLVPIYPETSGISSKWLRSRLAPLLFSQFIRELTDLLPAELVQDNRLLPLNKALPGAHFPSSQSGARAARYRFAFTEMLLLQLVGLIRRQKWAKLKPAYPFKTKAAQDEIDSLLKTLPFRLTGSQQKAVEDILTDFRSGQVMNRILVGDVGSGKTIVAALAALAGAASGWQSALMAPTEILAQQHYHTLKRIFAKKLRFGLLTSNSSKKERARLAQTQLVVGTQALLFDHNWVQQLGLVIIDEQHRFGVRQRTKLQNKSQGTHLLTMTATPIPRSLALTIYNYLDLSILKETPHPKNIKTWVIPESKRAESYRWIKEKIYQGSQVFVVCPFIQESETLTSIKAATTEFAKLEKIFPEFQLGLIHGRLKPEEKFLCLDKFRSGAIQVLIATPVVEVGIDIPNASIMLIEGAQRFGLAQLHQLRGRVGRIGQEAYCFLFPTLRSRAVIQRLKTLEETQDGFSLAEIDLKLRGPGTLYAETQHGWPELKYASYFDTELTQKTTQVAQELVFRNPNLIKYPQLRSQIKEAVTEPVGPS